MAEKREASFSYKNVSLLRKRRKNCDELTDEFPIENNTDTKDELPNDTLASIFYLKSLFPQKIFEDLTPAIILKHQIYCIVKDKTLVDRELNKLWKERKVQLFKLITGSDEFAVVLTDDFAAHVRKKANSKNFDLIENFLVNILPDCVDVSVSKQTLVHQHQYTEKEITILVNNGLLQCRDVGSWWLGIPGAGVFMKHFTKGRQSILQMIRKRKFKEILQQGEDASCLMEGGAVPYAKGLDYKTFRLVLKTEDLEKCKMRSRLGMLYHIYDIIGAEFVQSIETTSGPLLRLAT